MVGVISSQCDYGVVNLVILWLVVNMISAQQEKLFMSRQKITRTFSMNYLTFPSTLNSTQKFNAQVNAEIINTGKHPFILTKYIESHFHRLPCTAVRLAL